MLHPKPYALDEAIETLEAHVTSWHKIRFFQEPLRMLIMAARAASCRKCLGTGWAWVNATRVDDVGTRIACDRCRIWRKYSGLMQLEADKDELEAELRQAIATHLGTTNDTPVIDTILSLTNNYIQRVI